MLHNTFPQQDRELLEPPEEVLERCMNYAPDEDWATKQSRQQRVLSFIEMQHFLALARYYEEEDLAKRITNHNKFFVRLTSMVRGSGTDVPGRHEWPMRIGLTSTVQRFLCSRGAQQVCFGPTMVPPRCGRPTRRAGYYCAIVQHTISRAARPPWRICW